MVRDEKVMEAIKKKTIEWTEKIKEYSDSRPEHYKTDSIDVIDFCKQYNLNFNKGNIVKYICRAGKKENESELKDLEKALVYLQREINYLNQN